MSYKLKAEDDYGMKNFVDFKIHLVIALPYRECVRSKGNIVIQTHIVDN